MLRLLLICAGGALGSGGRYLLAQLVSRSQSGGLPYGTLAVNLLGSFLIGFVMQVSLERAGDSSDLRVFLVTGVLGGFTTYSAFSYESVRLFQAGSLGTAGLYVGATFVGCFALTALGIALAAALSR